MRAAPESLPDIPVIESRAEFHRRIQAALDHPETFSLPSEIKLVPEWERTGSDMLIALSSKDGEVDDTIRAMWDAILRAIPEGTRIHVAATGKADMYAQSELAPNHSHLKFSIYPLPLPGFNDEIFAQDIFFATGSRDAAGRFQLLTSIFDHFHFTREEMAEDGDTSSFKKLGVDYLADEVLAASYPKIFRSHSVPVKCEGGDLEIARLPNGESALVMGSSNSLLMVALQSVLIVGGTNRPFQEVFRESLQKLKELCKRAFGVEKIIILDEEQFFHRAQKFISHREKFTPAFYHQDMIIRPIQDPRGKHIAFWTQVDPSVMTLNAQDEGILYRARAQFASLGYEIEDLPCGSQPVQNYTNGPMFRPPGQPTTILLPQYGLKSDAIARTKYEARGFRVLPVDFSKIDPDEFSGSVHCMVEVLA